MLFSANSVPIFPPLLMLLSEIPKLPTDLTCERVSCTVSSFTTLSPGWVFVPKLFVSVFCFFFFFSSLSFVLPHFKEIGLSFCVSGVFLQYLEIVLWKLLQLQWFFFNFIFIEGELIYNVVVVFDIHWHESAMEVHVSLFLNSPSTSVPIPSLRAVPVHKPWVPYLMQ